MQLCHKAAAFIIAPLALCMAAGLPASVLPPEADASLYSQVQPFAVIAVTSADDDGPGSLREAIHTANVVGGNIVFDASLAGATVLLQSELPPLNTSLTITGPTGGASIAMAAAPTGGWRHFRVGNDTQPDFNVTITGLSLVGPGPDSALANVENGGIFAGGAGSTSLGNYDVSPHFTGTLTLTSCALAGNVGHDSDAITEAGGAGACLLAPSSSLVLQNCLFADNHALGLGGAVFSLGEVQGVGTTVESNTSRLTGGGMAVFGTSVFDSCTLSGNSSANTGGGALLHSGTLVNCTFADNHAGTNGGGLKGGVLALTQCTLSGNTMVELEGGAGVDSFASLAMDGCIVSGNYNAASHLREVSVGASPVPYSGSGAVEDVYGRRNLIGVPGAGLLVQPTLEDMQRLLVAQLNNRGEPVGLLADNGGGTKTILPAATSPALDAVSAGLYPALPQTDQRSIARPQGGAYDIGAVELVVSVPTPALQPTTAGAMAQTSPQTGEDARSTPWALTAAAAMVGLLLLATMREAGKTQGK